MLLSACSKPIADFALKDVQKENQLPLLLQADNTSKNASSYIWKLNGREVSTSDHLNHQVYDSGRYVIELEAIEEGKSHIQQEEIIVYPSETCLLLMRTSHGDLIFELLEETPLHLHNMEKLIESKYYNGLLFHRIIDDFMIQAGDNKTRSSGRRYDDPEPIQHEIITDYPHYKGALAAARMPDDINPERASSGSQFYIVDGRSYDLERMQKVQKEKYFDYTEEQLLTYVDKGGAPQLDGEYTVFGYMKQGFDVLDKIARVSTDKYDRPIDEVKILEVKFLN